MKDFNIIGLVGLTVARFDGATVGSGEVSIVTTDGKAIRQFHEQDCCESVSIESVRGNVADLIGSPITKADEHITGDWPADVPTEEYTESDTWTTFTFATAKGEVVMRWRGSSNGYYSESVSTVID